jgi:beta-lactamase class A
MFLKKPSGKNILTGVVCICLGLIFGIFLQKYYLPHTTSDSNYIVREGGYNFINPLLSCDLSENKQFSQYKPIEDKFKTYINQSIKAGDAQDISVYFRGLNSGHWSGVNENDTYSPASLLKVPIMIAYLREADSDPSILKKEITYHQTVDGNAVENYKPQSYILDGQTYTVAELIRYMIVDSDNNAATLLQNNVDSNDLLEVYSDIGIPVSGSLTDENMSPKDYSYIFRLLYNATYLSKSMSQYALELLSESYFPEGLEAGLPANIPSSNKFGERTVETKNAVTGNTTVDYRELHDCGIIYYPQNPYLLCVMTKGQDFSKLAKIIADISAMVYNETASGVLKI